MLKLKGGFALSEFWYTDTTMRAIDPAYRSFIHFSPLHFFLIAVAAAICAATAYFYKKSDAVLRRKILVVLAVLMVMSEIGKDLEALLTGQWEWAYLPFHLCGINIFVCFFYALKPSDFAAEFLYATCLPGATMALLVSTWNDLPFWNFMHLHSASVHIMLVTFPVLLVCGGFVPNFRRLPKVLGILALLCAPIYFINPVLKSNFFFLNGTENNPLLEALAGILGDKLYFLGFPVILGAVWVLMYLPWEIRKKRLGAKAK